MRIVQLVILVSSVYNSIQSNDDELMKLLPEFFVNATRGIEPHPDAGKDIYQILHDHGYKAESHWVTTEDGYVLRMQRIPNGKNLTDTGKSKPAVLLMHGMLSSSADWLIMGPNRSLAYMLADAGFDVWLGNNRGNTWSRNHLKLDPRVDAKEFWDFSFEDCGHYDLPAKIDYIIATTGQDRIFYVGHSQGTSQYFAMASLRPEYNDKIALMTALAPVAYMKHLASPLPRLAVKYMEAISLAADILKINELLGHSELLSLAARLACSDGSPFQEICATFLFFLCGFDSREMERNIIPVLATNSPAGISTKMLKHYGQEIRSGFFRQYDYGGLQNLAKYNSLTPPSFNMSAATAPVALYYSHNDLFAAVEDVERLANEMPNVVKRKLMKWKKFSHLDFILAKHIDCLLNRHVVDFMQEYLNRTSTTTSLPTTTTPSTSPTSPTSSTSPTSPTSPTSKPNSGYSNKSSILPLFVTMLLKIFL